MTELRRATVDDLSALALIHKLAHSQSHLTALLPYEVLMRYYRYFFNDDAKIWLALNESVDCTRRSSPIEGILDFASFGLGIPEKISVFKHACRLDFLLASLHPPLRAAKKVFSALMARITSVDAYSPTDYLLLSIAVAKQNGCSSVRLCVNSDNFSAINAYFSAGFSISNFQGGQFYMEKILE